MLNIFYRRFRTYSLNQFRRSNFCFIGLILLTIVFGLILLEQWQRETGKMVQAEVEAAAGFSVLSITPPQNAIDISKSSDIVIVFDESLNTGTVNQTNLPVWGLRSGLVSGSYSFSTTTLLNDTVTFNPNGDFEFGEEVQLTVTSNVQSSLVLPASEYFSQFLVEATEGSAKFFNQVIYAASGQPTDLEVGDVDNDGDQDIVTSNGNFGAPNLAVFLNNGDGTFAAPALYSSQANPRFITLGDLNNDGYPDAVLSAQNSLTINVFLNNGNGTFAAFTSYAVGGGTTGIDIADLDMEGFNDIAVAVAAPQQNVKIFINSGTGTFGAPTVYPAVATTHDVAIGDFDRDGDPDLAVTAINAGNTLSIFMNNGDGTFAPRVDYSLTGHAGFVITVDLNGDNYLDIATTGKFTNELIIFINNGNGTFAGEVNYSTGIGAASLADGDFDADGDLDLVVSNAQDEDASVFLNNGSGIFTLDQDYPLDPSAPIGTIAGLETADFNGNGALDFAVANNSATTISVLLADLPPQITIIQPNGGEDLDQGDLFNIIWTATDDSGTVSSVDLEVTLDDLTYNPIPGATGLTNTPPFSWTVPVANTSLARIRATATDPAANSAQDTSDATFNIGDVTPPTVTIVSPNGGETLQGGSTFDIIWNASDDSGTVSSVDLEVTLDDSTYNAIPGATGLANTPPFSLKWGRNGGDGSSGSGDGEFNGPRSVAVDSSNNVYVADMVNNRVQKFGSSGNFLIQWGTPGSGDLQFSFPFGLAVDSNNNVYVVDLGNRRIQKFDSSGTFLGWWGRDDIGGTGFHGPGSGRTGVAGSGDGEFNTPVDIGIDSGDNVYVTDNANRRIQKFDSSGTFLGWWGRDDIGGTGFHGPGSGRTGVAGSGDGEFNNPIDVAVDSFDNVYVADAGNDRVQKFDSSGTFLGWWGRDDLGGTGFHGPVSGRIGASGTGNGEFDFPQGLGVDSGDYVYVGDTDNHRIQKFDSSGTFFTTWGSNGTGDGQFNFPRGIDFDSGDNIFVADISNHRIQKFAPGGPPFGWLVSVQSSTLARIRATATDPVTNSAQDASDATFTIEAGGTSIQRLLERQRPAAPTVLSGQALSPSSVQWNFQDNSINETGFRLIDSQGNILAEVAQPDITSIEETGLPNNTAISGRSVVAYNDSGQSTPVGGYSEAITLMPVVTPLVIQHGPDSITVGVNETVNNLNIGQSGLNFELVILPSGETISSGWIQDQSYTFTGLNPNQEYSISVSARNQDGVSTEKSSFEQIMTTQDQIVQEVAPPDELAGFTIDLNIEPVSAAVISIGVLDPYIVLNASISIQNVGAGLATNVFVNLPLPQYMEFVPGSLVVGRDQQSSSPDGDIGQGGDNAVSAIWSEVASGQSHSLTFQLRFDVDDLRALARELMAAANPVIDLQASVSYSESPIVTASETVEFEPDIDVIIEELTLPPPPPLPPPPLEEPELVEGPPEVGDTEVLVDGAEFSIVVVSETTGEEIRVNGEMTTEEDAFVMEGTADEPGVEVVFIVNGQTFTAVSDENGNWEVVVLSDQLGLQIIGQTASVSIQMYIQSGNLRSETVSIGTVMLRVGINGELLLGLEELIEEQVVTKIFKTFTDPVEEVLEAQVSYIQASLATSAPLVLVASAVLWGYLPYLPTLVWHLVSWLVGLVRPRRKPRRYYGTAYDAITKRPLGLVIVRVLKDGKLVATRVSDRYGRYDFLLEPGNYTIDIKKPGYTFPSSIVKAEADGAYTNLYSTEEGLIVQEGTTQVPSTPLDPIDYKKLWLAANFFKKIFVAVQKIGTVVALPILIVGTLVSVATAFAIPDEMMNWILAALYVVMLAAQLRLRIPVRKAWGVVYDIATNASLPLATIQLIEPEFSKVVVSRLTDYDGRYSFLPEPGKYVIKANKSGYEQVEIVETPPKGRRPVKETIEVQKANQRVIGDVAMQGLNQDYHDEATITPMGPDKPDEESG